MFKVMLIHFDSCWPLVATTTRKRSRITMKNTFSVRPKCGTLCWALAVAVASHRRQCHHPSAGLLLPLLGQVGGEKMPWLPWLHGPKMMSLQICHGKRLPEAPQTSLNYVNIWHRMIYVLWLHMSLSLSLPLSISLWIAPAAWVIIMIIMI